MNWSYHFDERYLELLIARVEMQESRENLGRTSAVGSKLWQQQGICIYCEHVIYIAFWE